MMRSEIRDRILNGLNESTTEPSFWTLSEIDDVIGEGQEFLCEEAKLIKRTALVPFRAGATYYFTASIAPDIMAPYRVWHATNDWRLTPVTMRDLDERTVTWGTVTGDPKLWFPYAWNVFGIWPKPAAAGGVLRVDYVAWPPSLLHDDDQPEMPESDQEHLVLYGIYDGLLKQWDLPRAMVAFSQIVSALPDTLFRSVKELKAADMQVSVGNVRDASDERIQPA